MTGFVVHNQPANLDPLTTLVLAQIKQVAQPVLWFEARSSRRRRPTSRSRMLALLVTGAMSPADFMSSVQQATLTGLSRRGRGVELVILRQEIR